MEWWSELEGLSEVSRERSRAKMSLIIDRRWRRVAGAARDYHTAIGLFACVAEKSGSFDLSDLIESRIMLLRIRSAYLDHL